MRAIRQILSDRILATAMAVVIAYMLVLQAAVGGYARAATISPAADPFHVICAAYGTVDRSTDKSDSNPLSKSIDCPCAMLCRLAGSLTPAIATSFAFAIETADTIGSRMVPTDHASAPPQQRRLHAEPRAPPPVS